MGHIAIRRVYQPKPRPLADYQAAIVALEQVPVAARRYYLREHELEPYNTRSERAYYCNPESLRMAIAGVARGDRIHMGLLFRYMHWPKPLSSHLLRWGADRGYLEQITDRIYRIKRRPQFTPLPPPEPPNPVAEASSQEKG